MKVLRAIGAFFARIGRWIRDTAWVQPLLIVGGIFLIIFSIPYLSKWVSSWFTSSDAALKYYQSHEVKLDDKDENKATRLFDYLVSYEKGDSEGIEKGKKEFGSKFFISIVKEDCADCKTGYSGFQTLQKNWNKGAYTDMDGDFKLYTIFGDVTDDDDKLIFSKDGGFYDRYSAVFEGIVGYFDQESGNDYPYVSNAGVSETFYTNLKTWVEPDDSGVTTPTTFLVDTSKGDYTESFGVVSILFNYTAGTGVSDNSYTKANELRDCWKQVGHFKAA